MKQKMIKGLGVAAALALLVGCNEINFSGLFSITAPITFAQQGKAVLTVNPGQFQTKASLGQSGSQKQIKLEISNTNPPTKVQLNFDKNINIGEHFNLTAAQIGQNFDLAGDLATSVQDSPEYSGSESCTYQAPQTVCRSAEKSAEDADAAQGAFGDLLKAAAGDSAQFNGPMPPPHTPVCNTIWVNMPGTMFVRYHYETTNRDLTANFVQAGKTLGTYTGKSSDTQTVYTYQSQCR
jgi:hypothetical protein